MSVWWAALALLASPELSLVVPAPSQTLERAPGALRWAALVEPELEPDRLTRRVRALLNVDPLSPGALTEAGLDLGKPARIFSDLDHGVLLAGFAIKDLPRLRAAIADWKKRWPRAARIQPGDGWVTGDAPDHALAVTVVRGTFWISIGRAMRGPLLAVTSSTTRVVPPVALLKDPRLVPLRRASTQRPSVRKDAGAPPDVFGTLRDLPGARRIDGALWLTKQRARVEVDAWLDVAGEVGLQETLRSTPARRLVDWPETDVVADGVGALTPTGLRLLSQRARLPEDLVQSSTGEVQVALTRRGDVIFAAKLKPGQEASKLAALAASAGARRRGMIIELPGGAQALVVGAGEASLEQLRGADEVLGVPGLRLSLTPPGLMAALSARAAANDGLGPRTMDLLLVRLMLAPFLEATEKVSLEVKSSGPRLSAKALIDHR